MKQVINGKMYNTETAKHITGYSNGRGWSDFRHYEEDLYQKRTGEYFLAGEGGPLSPYAEACPSGGWDSGSGIKPLTDKAAREWVEHFSDVDTYISCFGEPEE